MEMSFGERLAAARTRAGYASQESLADRVGVSGRTIRNYETNKTRPPMPVLEKLVELLGDFTSQGDPVEVALRGSKLVEWRQDAVISTYKMHLYEQAREEAV